ncbi:helix-turn-helix transcriptional regulator [Lacticaseibacillus paracasei]|uniref:helix-turn-helix transcriptional regulator n=1 Tax=Lacticaseibacillus paracasei TaxID=1597 RepID=UPI0033987281
MNKLKQLREQKNISSDSFAEMLGVSPKTVNAWERGYRNPKPAAMQHIEDILGAPKEEIFFAAFSYKTSPSQEAVK